jgi:hypothetical protein
VVDEALKRVSVEGVSLDTVLLEMGAVSEPNLLQAISDVSGVRLVNLLDFEPNREAAALMPFKMALQLKVVPLSLDCNALHVASTWPIAQAQLKDVGFLLGKKIELWVAIECRVRDWQSVVYGQKSDPRFLKLISALESKALKGAVEPTAKPMPAPATKPSKGTLENPILLERPRQKKTPTSVASAPKTSPPLAATPHSPPIGPRLMPAPVDAVAYEVDLGDDDESKTSVVDTTAYAQFAKTNVPTVHPTRVKPIDQVESTRVLNLENYSNLARELLRSESVEGSSLGGPPVLFPGGVLPPRKEDRLESPPVPRPSRDLVTPASAPRPGATTLKHQTPFDDDAQVQTQEHRPFDETDFSDVSVVKLNVPGQTVGLSRGVMQSSPSGSNHGELLIAMPPEVVVPPEPAPKLPNTQTVPTKSVSGRISIPAITPVVNVGHRKAMPSAVRPLTPLPAPAFSQRTEPLDVALRSEAGSNRSPVPQPASSPTQQLWRSESGFASSTERSRQAEPGPRSESGFASSTERSRQAEPGPRSESGFASSTERSRQAEPGPRSELGMGSAPAGVYLPPPGLAGSSALEWSLQQARASLKSVATNREELLAVMLDYGRKTFDYVGAFAVLQGAAVGWDFRSDAIAVSSAEMADIRQLSVPLDVQSIFRTVALTRGSYVGPLPKDAYTQHYLALLGRAPRTVFVWPIEVQSRLVGLLYGDCGTRPVSQRRLADFLLFCQDLPSAFHELMLHRRQRLQRVSPAPQPPEAMAQHGTFASDGNWFNRLIALLIGPDASERAMAMLELLKTPEPSAWALAARFPGPTGWSRLPVLELPEPDELGPIPGALSRLGHAGALALASKLQDEDSDTRYLALLTAGSLHYPDLVEGVLQNVFDFEPDISSAARAAAASLRLLPEFELRLPSLRQQLKADDSLYQSLAARALGVLHDRHSIEGLISLTESDEAMCAQSAVDALKEITRAECGTDSEQWRAWFLLHQRERRIEWLVQALGAADFDLRLSSIDELAKAFGSTNGYFADAPESERSAAVEVWKQLVSNAPELDI